MASHLINEWVQGMRSAVQVQAMAASYLASTPDNPSPEMRKLAALGAWGLQRAHCERDLLRMQLTSLSAVPVPDLYMAKLPFRERVLKKGRLALETREHPFILPHMWLASLYEQPTLRVDDKTKRIRLQPRFYTKHEFKVCLRAERIT